METYSAVTIVPSFRPVSVPRRTMNGGQKEVFSNNPGPALLKLYHGQDTVLRLAGGGLLILHLFGMARNLPACRGDNALVVCTDEGIPWNAIKPGVPNRNFDFFIALDGPLPYLYFLSRVVSAPIRGPDCANSLAYSELKGSNSE